MGSPRAKDEVQRRIIFAVQRGRKRWGAAEDVKRKGRRVFSSMPLRPRRPPRLKRMVSEDVGVRCGDDLFVAERFDRVEPGGFEGGIHAEEDPDRRREAKADGE